VELLGVRPRALAQPIAFRLRLGADLGRGVLRRLRRALRDGRGLAPGFAEQALDLDLHLGALALGGSAFSSPSRIRSARACSVFWIGPQRNRWSRKNRTRNWTIATSTQ